MTNLIKINGIKYNFSFVDNKMIISNKKQVYLFPVIKGINFINLLKSL